MNDHLHDEELGAMLRDLDVPDHAPGFFDELRAQIAAEAPPALTVVGNPGDAAALPDSGRRHRAWKRNSLRLATVAAAASVIAVAVGVGLGGPGESPFAPQVASAEEVTRRVQAALASVRTLRGELVLRASEEADPTGITNVRYAFVTDDTGNFRLRGLTRQEDLAYDATSGVERAWSIDPDGNKFGGERRGVALGYPDQGPADWVLQRAVAATVRSLVASSDKTVQEVEHEGRDAWQLDTPVRANALTDLSGDRQLITVDQQTGLPVRIVESKQGRFLSELRLERLVVDGPVGPPDYTVTPPAGLQLTVTDVGWRRVTLAEAAARAGYRPLVPANAPEGFERVQVVYGDSTGPTGVEGSNPQTRRAIGVLYRRGLDVLLVTTRLRQVPGGVPEEDRARCGSACLAGSQWTDPLASGEGFDDEPEELTLAGGALDGAPAQLLVDPRATPHVWALTNDLVVTISGDLSRAELIAVAQSLQAG